MNKLDRRLLLSIFIVLLLSITIGYGYVTGNINMKGINKDKWNIIYTDLKVTEGSNKNSYSYISKDNTSINYNISLDLPGDYYEFIVKVVNKGTIPAKVEDSVTYYDKNNIKYTLSYLDGGQIKDGDILKPNTSKYIKIRVEYKKDISPDDLKYTKATTTSPLSLNYIEAS